jgi:OmpA-OmpF porin, OOP family
MKTRSLAVIAAICAVVAWVGIAGAEPDVKGSHDHPLLTRMPGYYISSYEVQEFAAYDPTVVGGPETHWEGKKTTIAYERGEGAPQVSMLQVTRNYEAAIKKAGGKVLGSDERRVAAEIRKGSAMAGVYVESFNDARSYEVTIVESGEMRQDVVADAAAMGRDLKASGKTVVYGIHFDTGSAVIKPDSEPTLAEMVKLLQANPSLKVYVVGHTDSVGELAMNLKLSADRADSLVKALVSRGIAAGRVKAAGVASYCPVASNKDEAGRALNRRVELVEQ